MTVSTTATKITSQGNGATTAWPFTFAIQSASEVVVTLTDSAGTVTTLPSSSYSVTINAATGSNPTPVGGSVTYPLSGSPLALGNFLTVQRIAPLTQPTSLANQGISWQSTIESALDDLTFQTQQLNFQIGQQFSVPVSDPPPATLPVASSRANQWAAFDSVGNMIAASAPSGAIPISAAMQPVVEAATLALGRTAFGLGNVATDNVGLGLVTSGSNLNVVFTPVADSTNKAVLSSFHLTDRHATGALTYTNPAASTLFAGFGYYVSALNSAITFAIDAGDTFSGASTGVSLIIPPGTQVYISTDGTTTWFVRQVQAIGLDSPLNLQINAAVASHQLTVSLKDRNGNDPSTASPMLLAFRDPTATGGDPVIRALSSALSIVIPFSGGVGGTLGTANSAAYRVWVVLFDNAGTLVLGLYNSVTGGGTPTQITGIDESAPSSGTTIANNSNSPATFYTASTITTKSFRILGYLDFSAGQATAGSWDTAPDKIQLFGPGIKKPGEAINKAFAATGAVATGTTALPYDDTIPQITEGDQYMTLAITPKAKPNILEIEAQGIFAGNSNSQLVMALFQDATAGALVATPIRLVSTGSAGMDHILYSMLAATVVSTTFRMRAGGTAGTITFNGEGAARLMGGVANSYMRITEYQV